MAGQLYRPLRLQCFVPCCVEPLPVGERSNMDTCRQKKSGLTGDSIVGLHFSSQILNDSVNLWLIACIHVSNLGDAGAVENFRLVNQHLYNRQPSYTRVTPCRGPVALARHRLRRLNSCMPVSFER